VASVEFGRGVALRWPASPSHRHWNRGIPADHPPQPRVPAPADQDTRRV